MPPVSLRGSLMFSSIIYVVCFTVYHQNSKERTSSY